MSSGQRYSIRSAGSTPSVTIRVVHMDYSPPPAAASIPLPASPPPPSTFATALLYTLPSPALPPQQQQQAPPHSPSQEPHTFNFLPPLNSKQSEEERARNERLRQLKQAQEMQRGKQRPNKLQRGKKSGGSALSTVKGMLSRVTSSLRAKGKGARFFGGGKGGVIVEEVEQGGLADQQQQPSQREATPKSKRRSPKAHETPTPRRSTQDSPATLNIKVRPLKTSPRRCSALHRKAPRLSVGAAHKIIDRPRPVPRRAETITFLSPQRRRARALKASPFRPSPTCTAATRRPPSAIANRFAVPSIASQDEWEYTDDEGPSGFTAESIAEGEDSPVQPAGSEWLGRDSLDLPSQPQRVSTSRAGSAFDRLPRVDSPSPLAGRFERLSLLAPNDENASPTPATRRRSISRASLASRDETGGSPFTALDSLLNLLEEEELATSSAHSETTETTAEDQCEQKEHSLTDDTASSSPTRDHLPFPSASTEPLKLSTRGRPPLPTSPEVASNGRRPNFETKLGGMDSGSKTMDSDQLNVRDEKEDEEGTSGDSSVDMSREADSSTSTDSSGSPGRGSPQRQRNSLGRLSTSSAPSLLSLLRPIDPRTVIRRESPHSWPRPPSDHPLFSSSSSPLADLSAEQGPIDAPSRPPPPPTPATVRSAVVTPIRKTVSLYDIISGYLFDSPSSRGSTVSRRSATTTSSRSSHGSVRFRRAGEEKEMKGDASVDVSSVTAEGEFAADWESMVRE